ncbi:MAG: extracellular solute-binding protein [Lentisphaerae bacterium]|jgi:ABC-type sugar transport system permease subunit/ABC-type glycerol-3-phosphate transport system substrate-binding protein|nr:extracellular solute-binding protein [Lentisphaerota bacterium]MBT4818129.1 extracellular solute-binding protein [Lentisphaerota bacterium]MBT5612969.1 extracellular solute-binding protein [Lentisphaerota bacterium]MBT7059047.1 extracellular solute-binding protein [Lentisphaerota bacterium]MBT7846434.1 extracellular solute-binding protein [Lentisphaerota bacterium]
MNPRLTRLLAVTGILALLGSAQRPWAGYIENRDGKTIIHVKVFGLPDPSNPATHNRAEVAGVRAFRARFPQIFAERYRETYRANPEKYGNHDWDNVEVELHKASGIRVEGVESDLLAIAGGLAPDVLYINFRKSDNYIQNSFLYPLDEYIDKMTQDELDFRVNRKIWPVIKRKGPDGTKRVWAFPYGGALGKVLLFRKDLFDSNGVSYPTAQWTWDNMIDAARRITDPETGVFGIVLARGKHESWYWCTFLWSAGGDVMTYEEETDQWSCTFGSREAAMALDFYTRLSAEKWVDETGKLRRGFSSKDAGESGYAKWERGEIGMLLSYIDEKVFSTINPELTGMVPVPLGPTGKRGGELNSRMMGLFAEIKDPAVRDAAWEYMRFYDCEEAAEIKTRIMVEGGLGRFVNPKYLRRFGYPEIERLAPKGWAETFEIAIETGRPEPYGRNSNLAYNLMTFPIQDAEHLAVNDQLPEDPEKRLDVLHGLLEDACARANEEMIGIISPRERFWRRLSAVIALVAIAITFTLVFRKIFKVFSPPPEELVQGQQKKSWDFKRYAWAYALLVPAVTTILIWRYIPLMRGSVMAFFDYRLLGKSAFVGVDNFGDLLFDNYWWMSVWNALRYSFFVLGLTFLPPIILAIALQEVPRGKLLFRLIYYLPAVITGLVTVVLWKQFYQPSERGALNAILLRIPAAGYIAIGLLFLAVCLAFTRRLWLHEMYLAAWAFAVAGVMLLLTSSGLATPILFRAGETLVESFSLIPSRLFSTVPEPYRWLSNPKTAMLSCVIPMVWAGMGPGCLIYLAALKGIPDDYYEAADIDGANFIDKILFVVFPTLKALIIINFVGVFIRSWYGATGSILVMTGGGANTETVGLHIWYKAFTFLKFGSATAMAWMLGFMLIGFTVHQLRILSRVEFRTAGQEK